MDFAGIPVFAFDLGPAADHEMAFRTATEAGGYLSGFMFSERMTRVLAPGRVPRSRPTIYTITGQPLTVRRTGVLRSSTLVKHGPPDDAGLQARLDDCASRREMAVPVVDRVALANHLMREHWESFWASYHSQPPTPLPRWIARRVPPPPSQPPQI